MIWYLWALTVVVGLVVIYFILKLLGDKTISKEAEKKEDKELESQENFNRKQELIDEANKIELEGPVNTAEDNLNEKDGETEPN